MPAEPKFDGNMETLFDLIGELCTASDIYDVLKDTKYALPKERKKEILIGGNKEDKVLNLRRAVSENLITREQAYELLRETEENGRQHILYFVPKNVANTSEEMKAENVAKKIWGRKWKEEAGFPKFTKLAPNLMFADFREVQPANTNYRTWWLKLYAVATSKKLTKTEHKGETQVIETYDIVTERVVYVVRWHSFGVLEVRLPSGYSAKVREQMFELVMAKIGNAIPMDAMKPWDLKNARSRLMREWESHKDIYTLGSTEAMDGDGYRTKLTPPSAEEVLNNSKGQKEIVKVLIKEDATSEEIAVIWQLDANKNIREPFKSVIGSDGTNHVYLAASLKSREVDYVTLKLREFAA